MENSRHENNLHLCFHGDDAPCMCACPFDFDLRSFTEKIQLGRFDAAYRLYSNAVVFPDIVWRICPAPCGEQCVRNGFDAPLSLNLLERACLSHARNTNPIAFNLPPKPQRIAIIGAGLSGLTCAMKFAPKKYDVTIYEKTGAIGGGLSPYIPEEIYLAEFQKQFGTEKYTLLLHTPVDDLSTLAYDAIYVSSGANTTGEGDHIFRCPPDIAPLDMILDGIASLHDIEWYLKTGKRKDKEQKKIGANPATAAWQKSLSLTQAVTPESGSILSKEEAVAEAKRCIRCDCSACLDNCELLRKYKMYPHRLMDEVNLTMNPVTMFTSRAALREISSCSQCGLCKQLCPVEVDIGDYFLRTKRELEAEGALPEAFHDFWLRDMAFSDEEAGLLLAPPDPHPTPSGGTPATCGQVFFPGCQLGASDPRYVALSYEYLLRYYPDTALLMRCCGAPALWAGNDGLHEAELTAIRTAWESLGKPVFLLACPSCRRMFHDYLPDIPCRMIFDTFSEHGFPEQCSPLEADSRASVFDPCSSRHHPDLQQHIRKLAESAGFTLDELPRNREDALCCSWGGQSFTADLALAKANTTKAIAQSDNPYITYCVNCRDIFSDAEKPCWHILDVLFGINDSRRPRPTATARRQNRIALKHKLLAQYGNGESIARHGGDDIQLSEGRTSDDGFELIIDIGLARRMSDALILEDDLYAVVQHCEDTGQKLYDPVTKRSIGHLKRGIITYWAVYAPAGEDRFLLFDAYSHRMVVNEEGYHEEM